ncbi:Phosphate ABC transporter, ATP-binding protein PstB-like [Desulfonema magnum]|uniref:Phosphate ABC transporter, ATP-binding protein PstB-like n=2 Tax=Desulfonema magnum TaxID=45655 RepID=A0A975BR58_9BACT|nr:Phosphate ABC transporter, ATP-binding protein PstB-like [Desulfonema magnum]
MPCTTHETMKENHIKIKVRSLDFWYQNRQILEHVSLDFTRHTITAIVGPSGTGKSTFLTTLNRLWENIPDAQMKGRVEIEFDGTFRDIYARSFSLTQLRRSVGMVFQTPNPLSMSIYKNVAFPLKLAGYKNRKEVGNKVEKALKQAYLWEEVKDRLHEKASCLSGGQQQRLCIARALILEPEVLLLDEPTSSLDQNAGRIIETLLLDLRERCTIIIVSHYLDQVGRIADTVMEFPLKS